MIARLLAVLLFFVLSPTILCAQINNVRCKWVKVKGATDLQLDSTTVLPSSISITGGGDSLRLNYDPNTGKSRWVGSSSADSVLVCYRVLSSDLSSTTITSDTCVCCKQNCTTRAIVFSSLRTGMITVSTIPPFVILRLKIQCQTEPF